MKQVTWKKRLEYFWMYYKIPFLAAVMISAAVIYFVHAKITEKDPAFNAILFDVHTNERQEDVESDFADYAGIDTEKYEVLISMDLLFSDSSSGAYTMASLSHFYTQTGTQELDVCMMLEEDFKVYAEADCFLDLREVFTEQELKQFPDLYRDSEGRVLGAYGDDLKKIRSMDGYSDPKTRSAAGIMYNTKHKEAAKQFLEYLLEEE